MKNIRIFFIDNRVVDIEINYKDFNVFVKSIFKNKFYLFKNYCFNTDKIIYIEEKTIYEKE